MSRILHATTVARWCDGGWRGVLLRGPSGSGKSSLALRLLGVGWRLVADDRTLVWASGGRLFGRAPATISGLIEARGVGVVPTSTLRWSEIRLLADLVDHKSVERAPEDASELFEGTAVPRIALWSHDAAAEDKLALALQAGFPCGAAPPWTQGPTGVSSSARCGSRTDSSGGGAQ